MERASPLLPADDLARARAFSVDALGFAVLFDTSPHDETRSARTFDLQDPFGNTLFVIGPPATR